MFAKLDEVEARFIELEKQLADPEMMKDMKEYSKIAKNHADLSEIVTKYREYKSIVKEIYVKNKIYNVVVK